MKSLTLLIVFAVLAFIVLSLLKKRGRSGERPTANNGAIPYFRKMPLSDPEQVLFHRLSEAAPGAHVLAQVALPALVGIRKNPNWQAQFNEISRKYVDFIVCNPDLSVKAVIELDDSTHQRGERIRADAIKDYVFKTIGVPMIRFDVREMPSVETIRRTIEKI